MYLNTGLAGYARVAAPQWNYRGRPGARSGTTSGVLIRIPIALAKPSGVGAYRPLRRYRRKHGFGDAASILAEQSSDQTNPFLTPAYYAEVAKENNDECAVDPSSSACQVWTTIQAPTIAQTNQNATQLDLANWCEQNVFNNQQFGTPLDTASCSGSQPLPSVVAAANTQGAKAPSWQASTSPNLTPAQAANIPTNTVACPVPLIYTPESGCIANPNAPKPAPSPTPAPAPAPAGSGNAAGSGGSGSGSTGTAPAGTTTTPDLSSLVNSSVSLFGYNIPVWGLAAVAIGGIFLFSGKGRG
jgi:hypothetical protein